MYIKRCKIFVDWHVLKVAIVPSRRPSFDRIIEDIDFNFYLSRMMDSVAT